MVVDFRDIEKLDIRTLRKLVDFKENSKVLERLQKKRDRLLAELTKTEKEIASFLRSYPELKAVLGREWAKRGSSRSGRGAVRSRMRRPRGWVQEQVRDVMKHAKKPMSPAEIRNAIIGKHPEEATKNLYLAVFQHLRRHKEYVQRKTGWTMVGK